MHYFITCILPAPPQIMKFFKIRISVSGLRVCALEPYRTPYTRSLIRRITKVGVNGEGIMLKRITNVLPKRVSTLLMHLYCTDQSVHY